MTWIDVWVSQFPDDKDRYGFMKHWFNHQKTLLNSVTTVALNNIIQECFHRVILYKHNICGDIQLRMRPFYANVQHVPACRTPVVVRPTTVMSSTCQPTTHQAALQQLTTKVGLSRPSRAFSAQYRYQATYSPQLQLSSLSGLAPDRESHTAQLSAMQQHCAYPANSLLSLAWLLSTELFHWRLIVIWHDHSAPSAWDKYL